MTDEPLDLPEGTAVVVSIDPAEGDTDRNPVRRLPEFDALDFHGMWADREDMIGSHAWERRMREQWRKRLSRRV